MGIINPGIPSVTADLVSIRRVDTATDDRQNVIEQRFRNLLTVFQEYGNARPIKASVAESSRLMSHPIENGTVITDHRVKLPVVISIAVILRPLFYRSMYATIREDFNSTQRFEIQTKTDVYRNMFLRDIPHEEDPDKFDTITMVLEFIEAQFFNVTEQALAESEVLQEADSSTIERGDQANRDGGAVGLNGLRAFARRLGRDVL